MNNTELVPLLVVRGAADAIDFCTQALGSKVLGGGRPKDGTTIEDRPPHGQARIDLVLGPVGAGKSTFAARLAEERHAVRLTLDEWMTKLFSPDRPDDGVMEWYRERAARCLAEIRTLALTMIDCDTNVILEIGLLTRREREAFYRWTDERRVDLTIHVLDAPRDVRRHRIEERNRTRGSTFSMVVPPAIFELASDLWEPVDASESQGRDVRFVDTGN